MIKKQTEKKPVEKPVEAKAKASRPRSEFPPEAVLGLTGVPHGSRPGSRRAAIMEKILTLVAEKATVGEILSAVRPMQGGPEDLRILAAKGCITLPEGVTPGQTRAMKVKLADASVAKSA